MPHTPHTPLSFPFPRLAVLTLLIELVLIHLETRTAAACRAVAVARLPERGPDGALLRVLDTGQVAPPRHAHCGRQIGRVCGKLVEDQSVAVAACLSRRQQQQRREANEGCFLAHSTAHTLQEIASYTTRNSLYTARQVFVILAKLFSICTHSKLMYTVKKYTAKKIYIRMSRLEFSLCAARWRLFASDDN